MKVGTKIILGFVMLVAIAVILGLIAVWQMTNVSTAANKLALEYVPEVAMANELERNALQTMYSVRGFTMGDDKKYLEEGRKNLEEVKKQVKAGQDLAARYPALVKLREQAAIAETKVKEYEKQLDDTAAKKEALAANRKMMVENAARFLKNANEFMDEQQARMEKELKEGLPAEKLVERFVKFDLANEIVRFGNLSRVAAWQGQAANDMKIIQEALKNFDEINKRLDQLAPITHTEANKKQLAEIKAGTEAYKKSMNDIVAIDQALQEINKKRQEAARGVLDISETTAKAGIDNTTKLSSESAASLSLANTIMVIGLIIAAIVGVGVALFITRSITKPLNRAIDGLNEGSDQVTGASNQVSAASQELAEGSSEQAAAVEETSSSLEEMTSMTRQNADNASQANALMDEAKATVNRAAGSMKEMTQAMAGISTSGQEISKIIKTIDEIAFQTNLLALNAAVEAARAGEAGAGFAVVADEVRNLAQRAAEAAKNTASLIEGTITQIGRGMELVRTADEAFTEVATNSAKVAELVGEIAAASNEQAQGITQINQAMSQMDQVTQKNAANAEETASASEELNAQAESMRDIVTELAAMVGGADKRLRAEHRPAAKAAAKAKAPARLPAGPAKTKAPARLPAGPAKTKAPAAGPPAKVAKADEVIPMDEDFGDF
ncbi:MAG: methyl-accepting chemotaxis protein [Thermodesulfobacteriota bacterium]